MAFKDAIPFLYRFHDFLRDGNCLLFYVPLGCLAFLVLITASSPQPWQHCKSPPEMEGCSGAQQTSPAFLLEPLPTCSPVLRHRNYFDYSLLCDPEKSSYFFVWWSSYFQVSQPLVLVSVECSVQLLKKGIIAWQVHFWELEFLRMSLFYTYN